MGRDNKRLLLINSTIAIIAKQGLDKATTKSIAGKANCNEVYIYRTFHDKEDLFKEVFAFLDQELVSAILTNLKIPELQDLDFEIRWRVAFFSCWNFILENREKCLTYLQYYYSPYFMKYSYEEHRRRYEKVIGKIMPYFSTEADIRMVMDHLFHTMLHFAEKILNGQLENCDETANSVFSLLSSGVKPYMNHIRKGEFEHAYRQDA